MAEESKPLAVQRAEDALVQADKELNKWSMFGGQEKKMEKAVEEYIKAGNLFKSAKHCGLYVIFYVLLILYRGRSRECFHDGRRHECEICTLLKRKPNHYFV
jgi:hypothetical protein